MTNTELKAQIDSQITNETSANAITPTDVGTNMKLIVDRTFMSYVAIVDQTDTSAPISSSVKNNTGFVFTWARTSVGVYTLTSNTSLTGITCVPLITNQFRTIDFQFTRTSNVFTLVTFADGILADNCLLANPLKIEFYE